MYHANKFMTQNNNQITIFSMIEEKSIRRFTIPTPEIMKFIFSQEERLTKVYGK